MPRQVYTATNNYNTMSCHVFTLSGDHTAIAAINTRYENLGALILHLTDIPANDAIANGLTVLTNNQIRNRMLDPNEDNELSAMELLSTEFGFTRQNGSGIWLCGHFELAEMLPSHMYVVSGATIFDTMPDTRVRRLPDINHRNPPSFIDLDNNPAPHDANGYSTAFLLPADEVYGVEVQALAAQTQIAVGSANANWQNG
ncbi:hypothetical protein [Aquimarina longa]|uniref:hypothetical protein n=1 Tax=Aquimarina longa TaxID=1080221 RepID=UPI0007823753|nr:hypothetical protein [Aquimarina longa]